MTNYSPELIARTALPYFDDINSRAALIAYADDLACTYADAPLRDRLISALDTDINDLLHNANLSDLNPDADNMTDADADALLDFMLDNNDFIPIIADALLARYPD